MSRLYVSQRLNTIAIGAIAHTQAVAQRLPDTGEACCHQRKVEAKEESESTLANGSHRHYGDTPSPRDPGECACDWVCGYKKVQTSPAQHDFGPSKASTAQHSVVNGRSTFATGSWQHAWPRVIKKEAPRRGGKLLKNEEKGGKMSKNSENKG